MRALPHLCLHINTLLEMEPKAFFPKRPDWLLLLVVIIGMAVLAAQAGFHVNPEQHVQSIEMSEPQYLHQKPITAIWLPGAMLYRLFGE